MKVYWKTFNKKHTPDPDQFPFGIRFYDAVQGGGKTLSMVFDAIELKKQYPDMKTITIVNSFKLLSSKHYKTTTLSILGNLIH